MFHKITGVPNWENKETRDLVREARKEFQDSLVHLRGKKDEYRDIKKANEVEREALKREARIAEMFKFTKMTKKISFLPALKSNGYLKDTNGISVGTTFMAHRDMSQIASPARSYEKYVFTPTKRDRSPAGSPGRQLSPPPVSKWGTVSATSRRKDWRATRLSGGDFFKREPGQEIDVYDLDYLKYMRKQDRGIEKPSSFYRRKQSLANPGLEPLKEELDKLRSERDKSTMRSSNKMKEAGKSRNFLLI